MNRLERAPDLEEALREALRGWQAGMWTAIPAIIQSFNANTMPGQETCTAQPTIQARVESRDGNPPVLGATLDVAPYWWVTLPLLVDVPVVFPGGGGYTLTFPVAKGDEALIVFSSRCIDAWWQSGVVQVQAELRMHDISDGFAFVGLKSQPRVLAGGVSTASAQLRSDDGQTYVDVAAGTIKLKAPTSVTIDSPLTTITGDLIVQGKATITKLFSYLAGLAGTGGSAGSTISGDLTHSSGDLSSNGKALHTHTHTDPQGGTTSPPI